MSIVHRKCRPLIRRRQACPSEPRYNQRCICTVVSVDSSSFPRVRACLQGCKYLEITKRGLGRPEMAPRLAMRELIRSSSAPLPQIWSPNDLITVAWFLDRPPLFVASTYSILRKETENDTNATASILQGRSFGERLAAELLWYSFLWQSSRVSHEGLALFPSICHV